MGYRTVAVFAAGVALGWLGAWITLGQRDPLAGPPPEHAATYSQLRAEPGPTLASAPADPVVRAQPVRDGNPAPAPPPLKSKPIVDDRLPPIRTAHEALESASRPLTRADAEQYYHDKFDTYFVKMVPPISSSQQEAIIDFLNSRIRDFLLPELAEWDLRDRLDPAVRDELSRSASEGRREAARHISKFILTREQLDALARFPLWKRAGRDMN